MRVAFLQLAMFTGPALAQFGFFDQMFHQGGQRQQQQQRSQRRNGENLVEASYYELECDRFLCADTLTCVDKPIDCPCAFQSELKCILPDKKSFVCISEPSNEDGPNCDTVLAAWQGKI